MASKVVKTVEETRAEKVEAKVSGVEKFYESNKKKIWTGVAAVLVVILAVLAYVKFVYQPKVAEAQAAAYPAEIAFQSGDYELALKGDGNNLGFEDVIAQYGAKGGKAVYMYAGVCCLETGAFEEALEYLGKYSGKEPVLAARATACKGDALVGLEEYAKAASTFEKAAASADNVFAAGYLFKAGLCYEKLGEPAKALALYKKIADKYPQSLEAYDIDKYIARVSE